MPTSHRASTCADRFWPKLALKSHALLVGFLGGVCSWQGCLLPWRPDCGAVVELLPEQRGTTDLCKVVLLVAGECARLGPPPLLLQRLARRCRAGDVCSRAIALLRLRMHKQRRLLRGCPSQASLCVLAFVSETPDAAHLLPSCNCVACLPAHSPRLHPARAPSDDDLRGGRHGHAAAQQGRHAVCSTTLKAT